jgi:parallel beta-helix repeat protein
MNLQENWARSGEPSSATFRGINAPSILEGEWTDLGQVLADAYHPDVLQLTNGSYIMAYNGDKYSSVSISLSNDLLNWGPPIEITSAHNPWEHSMVQLPNSSVLLAYADDPGWDIYTSISTDLVTWSTPSLALSDAGRAPSMILDKSGELRIVMINDDGANHHTPFISSSADYGATWDSATPLLSTPTDHDYAVGLLQLQNESYVIIFGSDRSGSWRFYLTLSDDFQTWSDPFELPLDICSGCYYHAIHQLWDGQIIFFYGAATGGIYSVQTADFLTWTPPLLVTPTDTSGPVLQSDSRRLIELANGSLRFFPATIIDSDPSRPTGIRCFAYDPPYGGWQGDQIISTETVIENRAILLNGSLLIGSEGNLTLQNSTFEIACSFQGEHGIVVESGGILTVEANSTIIPTNPYNPWFLEAKKGSALQLRDSYISHAGWEWGLHGTHSGLWINTANAEVVNCSIYKNYIGLYFFEAEGGLIANNTIMNTFSYGSFLNASARSTVSNNKMMYTGAPAIGLINSWGSYINDNSIVNGSISLEDSINCHIANNTLDYPGSFGIFLNNSANSQIVNNVVFYGGETGISITHSSTNCTVSGNFVNWVLSGISISESAVDCSVANNTVKWAWAGIVIMDFANRTLVSGNIILNSYAYSGIYISNASAATISNNVIYNSTPYGGIFLQSFSDNNLIEWNDFLNNTGSGSSQAYDSCTNNTFRYNHWSNWTSPDENGDGIVDSAYVIDGGASNADPSPLVAPHNGPVLLRARIVFPSGGDTVSGIANIQWTAPINWLDFDITYGVYYSPNNGSTWILLASGLTNTIYPWNITDLDDGSNYLIRVEIIDSYGFMTNITSSLFTILNTRTIVVTLIYPNGGEVLNGSVDISWSVNDTSTPLTYRIQYSWDGGELWDNLTTFDSSSSPVTWSWDTTQHYDSWLYLIRVTVITAKAVGNDTSDGIFSIDNDPEIVFEGLEITGPDNVFQVSSTITVSIDVAASVNVTLKQLSSENVPPASSDLDALEVFLDISLSDAAALVVLWINVSFAELPEDQDPNKVRIYFYNETSESWELVKQTGVDYENEVIWGWTDHVTTFGLLVAEPEELVEENPLGLLLLLTAAAVVVISAVAFVLYRRVKELEKGEERRKRERWQ